MNCKNLSTSLTRLLGEFPGSVDKFRFSDVIAAAAQRPADSFILDQLAEGSVILPARSSFHCTVSFPMIAFSDPLFFPPPQLLYCNDLSKDNSKHQYSPPGQQPQLLPSYLLVTTKSMLWGKKTIPYQPGVSCPARGCSSGHPQLHWRQKCRPCTACGWSGFWAGQSSPEGKGPSLSPCHFGRHFPSNKSVGTGRCFSTSTPLKHPGFTAVKDQEDGEALLWTPPLNGMLTLFTIGPILSSPLEITLSLVTM